MTTVIVQLSDLHIPAEGRLFDTIDTEGRLAGALESLIASSWDVAALLISGDVADRGEAASYQRAAPLLEDAAARLAAELIYIPGNHDDVCCFERELLHRYPTGRPADCVTWIGELRVIGLDSTAVDGHHGALSDAQLDRLADELEQPAQDGTILALHHPPVPSPLRILDDLQLRDPHRLAAVIRGSDVRVILCGHDHHVSAALFSGVPVWVAPSMAYTIDLLGGDDRLRGTAHGGITIVEIHRDTVVTTQMPVPDPTAGYVIDEALGTMLAAYNN
ncbi:MAG: metallophosphoesterase [Solirubrobacteraceae bacterium]